MLKKFVLMLIVTSASLFAQKAEQSLYFFNDANGFVANGRWIPSDPKEKAAYPSETELDCMRGTRTCMEATAEYYSGHPHVSLTLYQIIKWDENGIVATADGGICMTETMLISFADKSVSNTHSEKNLDKFDKGACKTAGATGTETDLFIIKNSDRWIADPYGSNGK
jgi:hypothetical protein